MNESKHYKTQKELTALNFNLPKGVGFNVDCIDVRNDQIDITLYTTNKLNVVWSHGVICDGDEIYLFIPTKENSCDGCSGEGRRLRDGFYGVDFTHSDISEWSPNERDDYFSGALDVDCPECEGSGKVKILDLVGVCENLSNAIKEFQKEEEYFDRERESERSMGC